MPNNKGPQELRHRFGKLVVDCENFVVELDGQVQNLSPRAFDVLLYLVEHRNHVVGKEELFESVWKETFVTDAALTRAVKEIRHAIGDDAHTPRYIETVHKRGYKFIAPVGAVSGPEGVIHEPPLRRHWRLALAGGSAVVLVGSALALNIAGLRDRILGSSPAPKIEAIAVLPLKNLSGDPEQEYFADGMTDALITELGKISALRVISIQSVLRYKGSDKQVPEIARELSVDALIEGGVLRSGQRVRITAQLIQARQERHLWAESYEGDVRDVLALQGGVAREVARRINVTVRPEEELRLASARPVRPEAYEDFVKGQQFYSRYSTRADKAIEYFKQAIAKDPSYAPAYAALANSYAHHMFFSYDEVYPEAEAAASKALELDDSLAEAHCAEAYVDWRFRWDWAAADREFRRGLELSPSSSSCQSLYGFYLTLMGQFEEAEAAHRRAIHLDPFNSRHSFMLGWHYTMARRYDDGIAEIREVLELYPDFGLARQQLGLLYAHKGMYAEALTEVEKLELGGGRTWVYTLSGRRELALEGIAYLEQAIKREYVDPGYIAILYALLGDNDHAIEWLEEGYRVRARWMMYIKVVPLLDNLRSDPRFQDLLARMNFPD